MFNWLKSLFIKPKLHIDKRGLQPIQILNNKMYKRDVVVQEQEYILHKGEWKVVVNNVNKEWNEELVIALCKDSNCNLSLKEAIILTTRLSYEDELRLIRYYGV